MVLDLLTGPDLVSCCVTGRRKQKAAKERAGLAKVSVVVVVVVVVFCSVFDVNVL